MPPKTAKPPLRTRFPRPHDDPASDADDVVELGVDEAGRGSLFGPVVAAAVAWNPAVTEQTHPDHVPWIRDSKTLSAKRRRALRDFIVETGALTVGVGTVGPERIDDINILNATHEAMRAALDDAYGRWQSAGAVPARTFLLIDGPSFPGYMRPGSPGNPNPDTDTAFIPYACIVDGDAIYRSIAAASIVAKVAHDEAIEALLQAHPALLAPYDLHKNMGYGTAAHRKALAEHGRTPFHRATFGTCCSATPVANAMV